MNYFLFFFFIMNSCTVETCSDWFFIITLARIECRRRLSDQEDTWRCEQSRCERQRCGRFTQVRAAEVRTFHRCTSGGGASGRGVNGRQRCEQATEVRTIGRGANNAYKENIRMDQHASRKSQRTTF